MRWVTFLACALLCSLVIQSTGSHPLFGGLGLTSYSVIDDTEDELEDILSNGDTFGSAIVPVGDLDDDGVIDFAVGATGAGTDGGGAVWILFMDSAGSVTSTQEISGDVELVDADLVFPDRFGGGLAALGDLDGDGVEDLAVASRGRGDYGTVFVLFLEDDGTISSFEEIDGESIVDSTSSSFAIDLSCPGDIDSDGVVDLVVGASGDDDDGENRGAVYVLFLSDEGTVDSQQKISDTEGDFLGGLSDGDRFGASVCGLGDINGDKVPDIAVGAIGDDSGGYVDNSDRGAVYILFLNDDGTVSDYNKIADGEGGFTGELDDENYFGGSVAFQRFGEDRAALAVGAAGTDFLAGDAWVLELDDTGAVVDQERLTDYLADVDVLLEADARFGSALSPIPDLSRGGIRGFAVGSSHMSGDGSNRGGIWLFYYDYEFIRGDADGDGVVSPLADALYLLEWNFTDGDDLPCPDAGDADDSGKVSGLVDAIFLLQYGFLSGSEPPDPGPTDCALDPSHDAVGCGVDLCP